MSIWKEIITAVNSDITTPLNKLINSIISKLDNTSYGLSAIKTGIDGINTNVNASVQSYPNVTVSVLDVDGEINVSGKGRVTLYTEGSGYFNYKISLDGSEFFYFKVWNTSYKAQSITFYFEKGLYLLGKSNSVNSTGICILQTA